ncbi:MAG: hypothetical protein O7C59_07765 [Rickettsia endosymbiont of Ixodes persulcatus]|nr:hypothetical protein [Rickettsia endosymbiont of Ixodes persulcatus]
MRNQNYGTVLIQKAEDLAL